MVPMVSLWIPVVVATVLCFLAGSVLHMLLPIHRRDWARLPDEDAVRSALRQAGAAPGNYMLPHPAGPQAMQDPAFLAKLAEGPVGIMTLRAPGPIRMGPPLTRQFFFHLVVSGVLAYLASRTLDPGATYLAVFRVVGTAGVLGYTAAIFPSAIWYGEPRGYVLGKVTDGVVWGLLTAGAFAAFWPA
jgi:nucleoside recognition membrane protein YjiH